MTIQISTDQLAENIRRLFVAIADKGTCAGCNATIFWIKHKNGRVAPYTETALNHFADCVKAKKFKK